MPTGNTVMIRPEPILLLLVSAFSAASPRDMKMYVFASSERQFCRLLCVWQVILLYGAAFEVNSF